MFEHNTEPGGKTLGHTRIIPILSHEPVEQHTAKTKDEPSAHPPEPVRTGAEAFEEVWLTVDEAVAYCAEQGLSRTAKTLRKWAERSFNVPEGEVISLREDTLWGRYRWKIEQASLVRKVAEELSRERDAHREPVQTGANDPNVLGVEFASSAKSNTVEPVRRGLNNAALAHPEKPNSHKTAPRSNTAEQVRTGSEQLALKSELAEELATLRAENKSLRERQKHDREEIGFLREEVTSNRSLKTDLAQNSNRLLETLETLAIGGRLERSVAPVNSKPPVRYEQRPTDTDRV